MRSNSRGRRASIEVLEARVVFNAGAVDPTFQTYRLQLQGTPIHTIADDNGKVLYGGDPSDTGPDGAGLYRLNSNGTIDTSFGVDGIAQFSFLGPNAAADIDAIAVLPDGKILVAGYEGNVIAFYRGPAYASVTPFIARVNSDGTLDKSFGIGGRVAADFNDVTAIAQLSSGEIVYAGDNGSPLSGASATNFCASRMHANGTNDTSFGVNGVASVALGSSFGASFIATSSFISPTGAAVVGGYGSGGAAIVRFTASGQPDKAFNAAVSPLLSNGMSDVYTAAQPDGKIVIEGASAAHPAIVERLNVNGTLDAMFGDRGVNILPLAIDGPVAIESNGDILASGAILAPDAPSNIAIAQLQSNGKLNPAFGRGGIGSSETGVGPVTQICIQSSGRIVIGGITEDYFSILSEIIRFLGDHTQLAAGQTAYTTGVSLAADPRLKGTVIASETIAFSTGVGSDKLSGQLQEWVEKETASGTLDFYYRLVMAPGSAQSVSDLVMSNFAGFTAYVDYRPDSIGSIAPATATRSLDQKSITFTFLPNASGGDGAMAAGQSSYALFIKTNATRFSDLGKVLLNNAVSLDGYEPTV